MIFICIFSVKK